MEFSIKTSSEISCTRTNGVKPNEMKRSGGRGRGSDGGGVVTDEYRPMWCDGDRDGKTGVERESVRERRMVKEEGSFCTRTYEKKNHKNGCSVLTSRGLKARCRGGTRLAWGWLRIGKGRG